MSEEQKAQVSEGIQEDSSASTQQAAQAVDESAADLQAQLQAAQAQAAEYLEGWQRARADFANYKKRTDREVQESHQNASINVLTGLLPVIDDLERALTNVPAELASNPWLNGVTLIQRKFQKMFEDQGVTIIDPVGQPFDPGKHEAVGVDSSTDAESGTITMTLQKGYVKGDKVLRPALVRVAE